MSLDSDDGLVYPAVKMDIKVNLDLSVVPSSIIRLPYKKYSQKATLLDIQYIQCCAHNEPIQIIC